MKAVTYRKYGPPEVLKIEEVEKPKPGKGEVLVKVQATTVTAGDVRMRRFDVPRFFWLFARFSLGIWRPKRPILGMELAGVVEAVGAGAKRFKVGDRVYGSVTRSGLGGYAEYKRLPEKSVFALMPSNLSFEEAAAVPIGGLTAFSFLRKAKIQSGQRILIYGASGSVGTFAIQIAKHLGAEVVGVCSSRNLDMVRSLGADQVFDYSNNSFIQNRDTYDVAFDAVGKASVRDLKKRLKPKGKFLHALRSDIRSCSNHLEMLTDMIEAGAIKPFIDRTYDLDDIVEAHRYVQTGRKRGNVVVRVAQEQMDPPNSLPYGAVSGNGVASKVSPIMSN